jgi:hypothetical protein
MSRDGWTVRWQENQSRTQSREIFRAPDGTEYVRAKRADLADLTVTFPKLPPLYLRKRSNLTAHLRREVAP